MRCALPLLCAASAAAWQPATLPRVVRTASPLRPSPRLPHPPVLSTSSALPSPPLASPEPRTPSPPLPSPLRSAALLLLPALLPALALASAGATEHLHLGQKIALWFSRTGLPDWAVLALISMVPAVELRGGVPVGNWMGLNPWLTLLICVLGNMLPIAPTLLALRSDFVKSLAKPLLLRAEKKLAGLPTGQSRTLALALFVGIPAPGTGAWTGAIIAYLLDMPFGSAMAAIFAGVVLAGLIMTVLTLAGKTGALIALAALIAAGVSAIGSAAKKETD
ncbi:hypothetical protein AB1Y20_012283 [Prymnesium parvum]|uniref:Small multi-drug export protein n=1 Tax=Prymnesium parvum TaxID=97485 RepID=A0AB34IQY5_PRYPA